jgi:hypothetical protein
MIPIHKRIQGQDYEIRMARGTDGVQLELRGQHIDELAYLLSRALNTIEHSRAPEWANELSECLETR